MSKAKKPSKEKFADCINCLGTGKVSNMVCSICGGKGKLKTLEIVINEIKKSN